MSENNNRWRMVFKCLLVSIVYLQALWLTFQAGHILAFKYGLSGEAEWLLLVPLVFLVPVALIAIIAISRRKKIIESLIFSVAFAIASTVICMVFAYVIQWLAL